MAMRTVLTVGSVHDLRVMNPSVVIPPRTLDLLEFVPIVGTNIPKKGIYESRRYPFDIAPAKDAGATAFEPRAKSSTL